VIPEKALASPIDIGKNEVILVFANKLTAHIFS